MFTKSLSLYLGLLYNYFILSLYLVSDNLITNTVFKLFLITTLIITAMFTDTDTDLKWVMSKWVINKWVMNNCLIHYFHIHLHTLECYRINLNSHSHTNSNITHYLGISSRGRCLWSTEIELLCSLSYLNSLFHMAGFPLVSLFQEVSL